MSLARPAGKPAGASTTWPFRPWLQKAATWASTVAFVLMHVACLAVFLTGTNPLALSLCGACYLLQMLGITAGYHRYFAHRSYKTSRTFQFVLAWLGCSAVQRGPLWWAAQHRHHHRTSDTPEDLHSPVAHNLWWSHVGWVLSRESDGTDEKAVRDLGRYRELRWLDRCHWLPPLTLAGLCLLVGGWSGLVWGFFMASVLSYHATFLVNSACHLWGGRRYATPDASRNNLFVALLTLGEGWHNNHHHYQSSANQGFFWWEIDVTYYLIRGLACFGLVWDVRTPPRTKRLGKHPVLPGTSRQPQARPPASDTPGPQALGADLATPPERWRGSGQPLPRPGLFPGGNGSCLLPALETVAEPCLPVRLAGGLDTRRSGTAARLPPEGEKHDGEPEEHDGEGKKGVVERSPFEGRPCHSSD